VGLVYYNLKDGKMRDVVSFEAGAGGLSKSGRPRKKTREEFEGEVGLAVGKAVEALHGILTGEFAPDCIDKMVCKRCVYIIVCPKGQKAVDAEDDEEGGGADEN
jgi:hypothetical protein